MGAAYQQRDVNGKHIYKYHASFHLAQPVLLTTEPYMAEGEEKGHNLWDSGY